MFDSLIETSARPESVAAHPLMTIRDLSLWYGDKQALDNVSFDVGSTGCLAFIGPSGCGKSTMLKCLNRMHDEVRDVHITGTIDMDGKDIMGPDIDPPLHRRRFGWVAQKPNPFAWSVYDNVAYGPKLHGMCDSRDELEALVEECLRRAALWDEVKDRMRTLRGGDLSGGQQQRLCIARALSTRPDVLLMDEPTGSIDPIATEKIERLILDLKASVSIIIITHSMMQARRVSDRVAYFQLGKLLELGPTGDVFAAAQNPDCRAYIAGAFG